MSKFNYQVIVTAQITNVRLDQAGTPALRSFHTHSHFLRRLPNSTRHHHWMQTASFEVAATVESIQILLNEAQDQLDFHVIESQKAIIVNLSEVVEEYCARTGETLASLLFHPVLWLREAALQMLKEKSNDARTGNPESVP